MLASHLEVFEACTVCGSIPDLHFCTNLFASVCKSTHLLFANLSRLRPKTSTLIHNEPRRVFGVKAAQMLWNQQLISTLYIHTDYIAQLLQQKNPQKLVLYERQKAGFKLWVRFSICSFISAGCLWVTGTLAASLLAVDMGLDVELGAHYNIA